MNKTKVYLALAAAALMAIIIAQNTAVVETKILFLSFAMPRAILLGVTLLIGIVIGIALTLHWGRKKEKIDPENPPKK
jgi:uncharacterized integral membrane protein